MESIDSIQFEEYVNSYLDRYLESINQNKEYFNIEFYEYLLKQIFDFSFKTILTLFYSFKKENLLKGNTAKERYSYFDNYSATDEFHNLVDEMYPLLKMKLDKMINNHITNYSDLIERIEKDKLEIYDKFRIDLDNIENWHIKYGVSDVHRGLKSICIIETNNKKIVYKPRSGKIDIFWGIFIDWFNSKNPSLKLNTNKILDKGEYHWQEYIDCKPCESESEIKNLYYRMGTLAAMAYVFKIEDLHMENIIVKEEFPYIVDLETIFQLNGFQNEKSKVKNATKILNKEIRQSILSTQLFPVPSKFYDSDVDISGITGKGGQIIKNGKIKIINQFTEDIEVIRVDNFTENKNNIGRIKDNFIDPKDYIKDITEGFKEGYMLLQNNKKEIMQLINSKKLFNDIYPRYLFRNTNLYAMILEMSKNPKYLKDKSELDRLYHFLSNENKNFKFKNVYQSEIADLLDDDIPYFYGCINDKVIYNSKGRECFILNKTPMTEVKERINSLNQRDLCNQIDYIVKSMTKQKKTWNSTRKKTDYYTIKSLDGNCSFIEAAKNIGDTLISKAVIDVKTETITWLNIQNTFPTWTIKPQDAFLYSGLAGNALFFSSLYLETKDIKYKKMLQKILNTIKIDIDNIKNKSSSAYNGIVSLAYLYAVLYNQTKEENMLWESVGIIKSYRSEILQNKYYDIVDGLSGILVVVLNIYELSKDKGLADLAMEIGNDIISNIQIKEEAACWHKGNGIELMLTGFSHGLAGVTYAIGKLNKTLQRKRYMSLIEILIKIENSYYCADVENWIDLRSEGITSSTNSPIHWCHGAAGIGLSRLKNKDIINTSIDVDKALKAVIRNGLYRESDCLCHGNLGNLELLLEIYKSSDDSSLYKKAINRATEIIIEGEYGNGYRNGIGQAFDSPSFMLGLPGIGYEMLRMSDPTKYPSVLLLEV